jgi:hypothetical protein
MLFLGNPLPFKAQDEKIRQHGHSNRSLDTFRFFSDLLLPKAASGFEFVEQAFNEPTAGIHQEEKDRVSLWSAKIIKIRSRGLEPYKVIVWKLDKAGSMPAPR